MTVQWSSNRVDIDFTDVVNLLAGVGISTRFPTRGEYVAIQFVGTGGTVIRYQTGFREAGASASVIASLGTGAKVLKAEIPGIRSIISSDGSATITELSEEVDITMTSAGVTLASAGGTETLVQDGIGPALANKGLTAGTGITLLGGANDVTISNASPASSVTLASAGGTETLVADGIGPDVEVKGLSAGADISLVGAAGDVTIAFDGVVSPYERTGSLISPVLTPVSAIVSGVGNSIVPQNSFIGGGDSNSLIGGGAQRGGIVGGDTNSIEGSRNGVILGGDTNTIDPSNNSGNNAILGGITNSIIRLTGASSVQANVVCGGTVNVMDNTVHCGIFAGRDNTVTGPGQPNQSAIIAGRDNTMIDAQTAVICGGRSNLIEASGNSGDNVLVGGDTNSITRLTGGGSVQQNVIVGGTQNNIDNAANSVIVGGDLNVIEGGNRNIIAGADNRIAAGQRNSIIGTDNSISGGAGTQNVILGSDHTLTGGFQSSLIGSNVTCTHTGNFLFSDSAGGTALASSANHRFDARCSGGATFYSNTANTLGVTLAAGGAAWAAVSDRNMKDLHGDVNPAQILTQVRQLPIYRYNYKGQDREMRYIGPCAQDWHNLFPSGKDPLKIDTIDPVGVALACCRALDTRIDDTDEEMDRGVVILERKIDELTARLDDIQLQLSSLTT
jgi:hypothetical protein